MEQRFITITFGGVTVEAVLNESRVAGMVWDRLPINARANTWGDEIYFDIPVKTSLDSPVGEVRKWDIGYWPDGACFCIFFGPTPVSRGGTIKPASDVEVIGKLVTEDYTSLKKVTDGQPVVMRKKTEG